MYKNKNDISEDISKLINEIEIIDIHTHLFPPAFNSLYLSGIDELLTYHYLIAEFFLYEKNITPEKFYTMKKREQADLIWNKIFIEYSPISEAARGVLSVLNAFGLNPVPQKLDEIRNYLKNIKQEDYIDKIFKTANIKYLFMTNNPFDKEETQYWNKKVYIDNRFKSALRIDDLLFNYNKVKDILSGDGKIINDNLDNNSIENLKSFLKEKIELISPYYVMCSVPPDFKYPAENNFTTKMLDNVIFPILKEYKLAFALMLGVRRQVNPELQLAGDGIGKADINTVINLAGMHRDIKFLMTFLSRENIHETAVIARKFNNLKLFGCWWFTNTPSLIEEIVKIRMELLGLNFIPQHSDARIIEQLIYKWQHFKTILKKILTEKYIDLFHKGYKFDNQKIANDITELYQNQFLDFAGKEL